MCQPVDKRVINRIHELVAEGLTSVNQVKPQLDFFVKNVLFRDKELPQITNRRFYPTKKDIHSHIFRAKVKNCDSTKSSLVSNEKSRKESGTQAYQPFSSSVTVNDSLIGLPNDTETILHDEASITLPNDTNAAFPEEGKGQNCRDLLEQIRQLTFVINDEEMLGRLKSNLQELLAKMRLRCCAGQSGDHNALEVADENNSML